MIDFATAWDELEIGQRVRVSNGQPEPAEQPSVQHSIWRSHNHEGEVVEKIGGQFRAIRVRLDEHEGAQVSYDISEASGDQFEPL